MFPAYILSGGRSTRFGSDKSRYLTAAGPQLLALADRLRSQGHEVHIVADAADRYTDWGVTCIVDVQPNSGPMAGLAAALGHRQAVRLGDRQSGWILLVSCDQYVWQNTWYEELNSSVSQSVDASVYFDSQWQPLPALYHCDLLPSIMQRLMLGELSLHGLLDSLGERVSKVATTQPPSRWSFNTLSELDRNFAQD